MNKRIVFAFAILALSLSSAACRPEVTEEAVPETVLETVSEDTSVEIKTPADPNPAFFELEDQVYEYLDITPQVHDFKDFGTVEYISRTLQCTLCDETLGEYYGEYIKIDPKYSEKADIITQSVKDYSLEKYNRYKEKITDIYCSKDLNDCASIGHGTDYSYRETNRISDIRLFDNCMAIDFEYDEYESCNHIRPFGGCFLFDLNTGERIDLAMIFPGTLEDYKKIVAEKTKEYYLTQASPEVRDWEPDAESVYEVACNYVDRIGFDVRYEADGVYVMYAPFWLAHYREGFVGVFISYEELGITK